MWDGPNSSETFFKTYMLWHHLKNLHDVTPFVKHACGTKPHSELEWIYGLLARNSIKLSEELGLSRHLKTSYQDVLWSRWNLGFAKANHELKLWRQMWKGFYTVTFVIILCHPAKHTAEDKWCYAELAFVDRGITKCVLDGWICKCCIKRFNWCLNYIWLQKASLSWQPFKISSVFCWKTWHINLKDFFFFYPCIKDEKLICHKMKIHPIC